jgi:hypothetical protein
MSSSPETNPESKRWRGMAAEARAKAETMKDPIARETMLKVASLYDDLAVRAEKRAATAPSIRRS